MTPIRTLTVASLSILLLSAGCGGGDSSTSPTTAAGGTTTSGLAATTTMVAATTTTRSAETLKAALLQQSDVRGSAVSPPDEGDTDLSACFPGNPLGAKTDPSEVDSPDLDLTDGAVQRFYASSARVGTVEQAKAFVATFGSAAGSACALKAFKAALAAPPDPVDPSALQGKPSTAAVADGGAVLTVTGNVVAAGTSTPAGAEVLVFQKGPVVVFVSITAFGGAVMPGKALELARKIAGRLS